jgi:hypothetical protein
MPDPVVTPGLGTLLQYESATPGTYTTVAQRVEITGPGMEHRTKETTNLDTPQATYRGTIFDAGEVGMKVQLKPSDATHQKLVALVKSGALTNWQLTLADSGAAVIGPFAAILSKFELSGMTAEGDVEADISLRVSGNIDMTP